MTRRPSRFRRGAILIALTALLPSSAALADPAPASALPPDRQQQQAAEIDRAETWALYGIFAPLGVATALAIVTNPSENDVPIGVIATIGGLWALSGTWGTSLGYYRAGAPRYATWSGLAKTALLAGTVFTDYQLGKREGEGGSGMPLLSVLGMVGVVVWDVFDYRDIADTIRERDQAVTGGPRLAPMLALTARRQVLGIAGRF